METDLHPDLRELGDLGIGDDVTKSHYVDRASRTCCQNKACGTVFGYPTFRRPHHCKRCGEIFCRPCLENTRRLNVMALPDPLGIPCKVCPQCYTDREVVLGVTTRSVTEIFKVIRKLARKELNDIKCDVTISERRGTVIPAFWKEQFSVDILKECRRLLEGFKEEVGQSGTNIALHELKKYIGVPEWQKSTFWILESAIETCRQCHRKISKAGKLRNCRVCGLRLCKYCSMKELLLYYEDQEKRSEDLPRMAIIRLQGCPEVEPKFSVLLHCCKDCKKEISERQVEDEDWFKEKPVCTQDIIEVITAFDTTFSKLSTEVTDSLDKLTEINSKQGIPTTVTDTDTELDRVAPTALEKKDCKEATKAKLSEYQSLFTSLRKVCLKQKDCIIGQRQNLVKNYFIARNEFYNISNSRFLKMSS